MAAVLKAYARPGVFLSQGRRHARDSRDVVQHYLKDQKSLRRPLNPQSRRANRSLRERAHQAYVFWVEDEACKPIEADV